MTQKIVNSTKGLNTDSNILTLPEGSLLVADNTVISSSNIIDSRRGITQYGAIGSTNDRAKQILQYKGRTLAHYGTTLTYDDGAGTYSNFSGTYTEMDSGLRIKGIESNGNFYFTTQEGIRKISATSPSEFTTTANYIVDAGAVEALDGLGAADTGTAGFLSTQSVCAYRVLWGYKDANSNAIIGAPSSTIIVRNTASVLTAVVDLEFTIPQDVNNNSGYFFQIYRSPVKADPTGDTPPSDELQLVAEDFPTPTDLSNGYVTFQDVQPESYRQDSAYLYTNLQNGETGNVSKGINNANLQPPLAKSIAKYKGSIFYANTSSKHNMLLSLISAATLTIGDKITISDGLVSGVYEVAAAEDIPNKKFQQFTAGSIAQNIDDTARSLVRVVNRDTTGPVYISYISGENELPGQMLLKRRDNEDDDFYVQIDNAASSGAFNPSIPTDTSLVSENDVKSNRIYYSKFEEPESVPSLHFFDIGGRDEAINNIIGLRDALVILKTDGIYTITGEGINNFTVQQQDANAPLVAADTAVSLSNSVYMMSAQGILKFDGNNASILSFNINDTILPTTNLANFATASFGIGYESEPCYIVYLPTVNSDTVATQAFRFDLFTTCWTRWTNSFTCGVVNKEDDKLYMGAPDINYVETERKTFDRTDYADRQWTNNIVPVTNEGEIRFTNTNNVGINDVITQPQYVTVFKFNQLLRRLDTDIFLDDTDYLSSLESMAGSDMAEKITNLVAKINADDTTQVYTTPSGSNTLLNLQADFNLLIDELNSSAGVFISNYAKVETLITYESIIATIGANSPIITFDVNNPFIVGEITVYNNIESEVRWAPQTVGDPSLVKQFRETTVMFDRYNFTDGTITYRTDISPSIAEVPFQAEGVGYFGAGNYGELTYGGNANRQGYRSYVPRNKQRARWITLGFKHQAAREIFRIIGYSVTFNSGTASTRGYGEMF